MAPQPGMSAHPELIWATSTFSSMKPDETWHWHPWQSGLNTQDGVEPLNETSLREKRLLAIKVTTAQHPVIAGLSGFRPPYIVGLWSTSVRQFVGFIVLEQAIPIPGADTIPFYFRTYRKQLLGQQTGLLQHSFPLETEPTEAQLHQLIRQELAATNQQTAPPANNQTYYGFG